MLIENTLFGIVNKITTAINRLKEFEPIYDNGFNRVGCIGCPLSYNHKNELEKYPIYKEAYFRAAKKWIEHRIERELEHSGIMESPEKYFDWWINKI
jgi:phosphoadenosine phosphosulfate reductase